MSCNDNLKEKHGLVTFKGNPLTLLGPVIEVGTTAPDFTALRTDLTAVKLSDFAGKTVLISAVPSLDTPVCDLQTKRFNTEAGKLGNAVVLTVSMDLPFAQARWCGVNDAGNIVPLSDHRDACFGGCFGVLIKELRLLARSIFVIGPDQTVKYVEIVPEVTNEPDYARAIEAARA